MSIQDGPFAPKLRNGKRLEDSIEDVISQRKFSLRYNKKEREEYNIKARRLGNILHKPEIYGYPNIGDRLKAHPFYSPLNPEIAFLYLGCFNTALGILLGYTTSDSSNSIESIISFGVTVGLGTTFLEGVAGVIEGHYFYKKLKQKPFRGFSPFD